MLLAFPARLLAALTACTALVALVLKFVVTLRITGGSAPEAAWYLARYFTILSNAIVILAFGWMTVTGRRMHDSLVAGLVLWIGAAGLVYRLLLADLWEPLGLNWYADQAVHGIVPLLVFVWWLAFGRTDRLGWVDPLLWMIWPVLYLAYALLRGAADGIYPYPFLDPGRLTWPQLTWNVSRLMEGFLIAGYALLALSHLRIRRRLRRFLQKAQRR
ncbi:Pr6Pr family membrane protein [Pseudoruegeria sp. HB172150]|uniref:Pr6Pr family membrane protein n=1 Tax=Pseudoruegeria sp. HB172150 TaxID=2721164 RepID=UPI0015567188|nr:Pr6Pr family membrane protein [Pseudoruegeria sp. HB172150]